MPGCLIHPARTAHILRRMREEGFLETGALKDALAVSPVLVPQQPERNRTPYFVEVIKDEVVRRWGRSALSFGALNIRTTLELYIQKAAEKSVVKGVTDLDVRLGFGAYEDAGKGDRRDYMQAALVSLEPATGYVRALVGGRDIFINFFNRAAASRRQPGSGLKPFVYLGVTTAAWALVNSANSASAQVMELIGHEWVAEMGR